MIRESDSQGPASGAGRRRQGWSHWSSLLLIIPFVALLWTPFYNSRTPELSGIPFFAWYQFLWVLLGAAVTGIVYLLQRPGEDS